MSFHWYQTNENVLHNDILVVLKIDRQRFDQTYAFHFGQILHGNDFLVINKIIVFFDQLRPWIDFIFLTWVNLKKKKKVILNLLCFDHVGCVF